MAISAKVKDRLVAGIKKFQPIVAKARDKDINESDTVTIITDILEAVFGYEKYSEITSELAIKKTFCDLAIRLDGTIRLLIEAKAAGLDLKEQHIKQAVDYGSNSGLDWVILTNAVTWKVYRIIFSKPINADLVYEFDFAQLNPRKDEDLEMLYLITKESMGKASNNQLEELHNQKMLLNKYIIGQVMMAEPVLDAVRRTLKKVATGVRVSNEEVLRIVEEEVIKRDVLDDDRAKEAKKRVGKALADKKQETAPTHG